MDNPIFSGTALVEIQGSSALRFVGLGPNGAEYQVIGFDDAITILDRRHSGLRAISETLRTGNVDGFAPQFNTPAMVKMSEGHTSNLRIELSETKDPTPNYRLWIAIGIEDRIPVYDYLFERLVPFGDDRFAFLALYRRDEGAVLELPSPELFAAV